MAGELIEIRGITKTFGGTVALKNVSLGIAKGECHALLGENGAGKSTLGKVLAGVHIPDSGEIFLRGVNVAFKSPRDAYSAGIGMVQQEPAFCPELSVAENLSIGRYPKRSGIFVDKRAMRERAQKLLGAIGVALDVDTPMKDLSVAQHQLVLIASAIGTGADVLIFDEPTSSLSEAESERLFALIGELREKGVTMIYVSHRLGEIFRLCDRISILRDGSFVGTVRREETSQDEIVRMMIGRKVEEYFARHRAKERGKELLRVEGLSSPGRFADVSFSVHAGEIVGMAGLVGSGRSEVAQAIFGLDKHSSGRVLLNGRDISRLTVRKRMDAGLGYVPEDRKRQGLALILSSRVNFSLTLLEKLKRFFLLSRSKENAFIEKYFTQLAVKGASPDDPVSSLSGGNQQKVVLAKWLARESKVLIIDEPTRGVDVSVKASIHALIDDLASAGMGILLISSELPEVLNLSTRILVMRDGRLAAELPGEGAKQEEVLRSMSGLEKE